MKKTTGTFLKSPSTIGVLLAVLVIALSVFGLLLLQQPLSQPQELTSQASVDNGSVEITYQAMTDQLLEVGVPTEVVLGINTNSIQTDGVQVVFNVVTDTFNTMTADVITSTGLQAASTQVERTNDGFLVGALALPAQIGYPFTTTTRVSFLKIGFTPTKTGTVEFNFDPENSIVTVFGSNPVQDQLMHVPGLVLTVVDSSVASPSPSPSTSPSVSPSPTPSPSPSPSPSPNTVSGCDGTCTSNASCGINQRCYNVGNGSRCRLATNPTSNTCAAANAGPNYSCNKYCADTTECASGLTCWNNQCRRPDNIASTTCAALSQTQQQLLAASCNDACSSNADCAANLRCYQGQCRLVTNPSSTSCTPETVSSVSKTYSPVKGAPEDTKLATSSATPSPAATSSASITPSPLATIFPVATPTPAPVPKDETALDLLRSMMRTPESALPLIVIGSGIGLLLLALVILVLKNLFGKGRGGSSTTPRTPHQVPPMHPTPVERAQMSQEVQQSQPGIDSQPKITLPPTTARNMTSPTASTPSSSMLERMKQKGITPPTSGQS